MKVDQAVDRLNEQLPLAARQAALPAELRQLHQYVLRSLAQLGVAPGREDLAARLTTQNVDAALARLGHDDLVVLNAGGRAILGAYPLTTEITRHRLDIGGTYVHAMCALDALAVGPMFNVEVRIDSRCRVTSEAIHIEVARDALRSAEPSTALVGVRWQSPSGCAAHSMCTEMVFLRDREIAAQWQGNDEAYASIFELPGALAFGAAFFRPLLT